MTSKELRQRFLDFFERHGHKIVSSSSLLSTDPSVLFTTAGMQQFKPYYLGEPSPYGKNTASCQKCFRTSDINEVGNERHLTFFEMLGNFSFAGYFKEEAIKLAKEFLDELKMNIDYVTVFKGEGEIPRDEESAKIWQELGFSEENGKLRFENRKENFWGPTGSEGPCGPTTEIYVNGIEIWNIVFNQYYSKNGELQPLKTPGIDTGMGLERLAKVMQKTETIFETDLFLPIIKEIEKLSGVSYWKDGPSNTQRLFRIIADHTKAAVFLASEGILPSNVERGYVLRRLIRRVVRYGKLLKMPDDFIIPLVKKVVEIYKDIYSELKEKEDEVISIVRQEGEKFEKTLEKGLEELHRIIHWKNQKDLASVKEVSPSGKISDSSDPIEEAKELGQKLFLLYQSYGFPLEISLEEFEGFWKEKIYFKENVIKSFWDELKKHQELSRTASAGMFKGGLADASLETTKLHTAAHLMLAGLRKVLGEHVVQKGSNITAERLRFDFSHKEKMTKEQIKEVENFVNDIIKKDLPVGFEEMTLEKAKELKATGVFESKYGDKVKVYTIGSSDEIASREICGGPHVDRTGVLGHFKIQKEESSSGGVRRIKAILK